MVELENELSHMTTVRVSAQDKHLLKQIGVGYTEAIKKFCHERRMAEEMGFERGFLQLTEKLEQMTTKFQKLLTETSKKLDEKTFNEILNEI